jgi:hypothetical protein
MKAGWPAGHEITHGCQFLAGQAEQLSMELHSDSIRKTYKYKLMPTPAQELALETVLWRCRTLYNVAP